MTGRKPKAGVCLPALFVFAIFSSTIPIARAQTLNATSLPFGNVAIQTAGEPKIVTLSNTQTVALSISSISTSGDFSQTSKCPIAPQTLAAGTSCQITVTFAPTALGAESGTLAVTDNASTSPQTASLTGTGVSPVSVTPSTYNLGSLVVGTSTTAKTIMVLNYQFAPLTIASINVTGDFSTTTTCPLSPSTLAARASCTISVTFTPTAAGTRTGTVTVAHNASNSPQTVQLTGAGIADVALTSASFTFASEAVGDSSAAKVITLKNNLTTALTITGISMSGPFSETSTCPLSPSTLAAGATCAISVVFTPKAAGAASGVLSVADNAAGSPHTVTLTGAATSVAGVSLNPTSLTFPTQHIAQPTSPMTVTLNNNQSSVLTISSIGASGDFSESATTCPLSPSTLAANSTCTISVIFMPSQLGTRTGTLTVADSAGTQTTALTGTGNLTGLLSLAVTPLNPPVMIPGAQLQLAATATFTNHTTAVITSFVTWSSTVPTYAQVNASAVVTAISTGQAIIEATYGKVVGQSVINVAAPVANSIILTPANPSVPAGGSQQFTALVHYNNGVTKYSTSAVTWSSSSNTIATVSSSGYASAASAGSATIRASLGSLTGSTTLNVTQPACTAAPAGLIGWWTGDSNTIDIAGSHSGGLQNGATYGAGEVAQGLSLAGNGASMLVNSPVYSPTAGTLMFWFNPSSTGAITGGYAGGQNRAPGFLIDSSGNLDWEFGNLEGQSLGQIALNRWYHVALTYTASATGTTSIAVFLNGALAAHALATSNTAWNPQVVFGSYMGAQQPSFAGSIDEISVFSSVLTAAQVKQIYSAYSAGMCKTTLQSIALNPATPNLAPGLTMPFTAAGTYSDTTTHDLTSSAAWSTGSTAIASITSAGLLSAVTGGSTTVTAALGSVQGSTTLAVKPSLVSLQVTPANPSAHVGGTQAFTATGTFSDGSTQNLTSSVTWTSSSSVATIARNGTATVVSAGQTTITAMAGSVTATTLLTVNSATLKSIAVTPATASNVAGTGEQFTATGTFSDGSKQNLTSSATWTSSAAGIATVAANGVSSAITAGQTTITAASGSVTGTSTLTVTAAVLAQLQIGPPSPSMIIGGSQQFTLTGIYSNGVTANLSSSATWTSAPAIVASMSTASPGLATSVGTGAARITATYGGFTASTSLNVQDQLLSIRLTPSAFSIATGQTQQFTAMGSFESGITQNISNSVTWTSSTQAIASVSSSGLATSAATGQTTIKASLAGFSASSVLTVGAPNVVGEWTTLSAMMPINPIHVALLPNGNILVIAGSGNCGPKLSYCPQGPTYGPSSNSGALLIQPGTWQILDQFTMDWDMFCNGMVLLQDGTVLVAGGTTNYYPFEGSNWASIFNPATNTFTNTPNMAHGRWYPTLLTLSDGTVMTFSGLTETAATNTAVEIYTIGSGWSQEYIAGWTPDLYPRLHLLPNGTVFYSSAETTSRIYTPSTQTWSGPIATTNFGQNRLYGSSVLLPLTPANNYDPKVIILGGANPSTNTTEVIDLGAATPTWQYGPPMSQPRIEMNATLLPNGEMLALGGSLNNEDTSTASLYADLYNPATNTFSSAGENTFARLYHSVSVLLPDATVWVAGGNPAQGNFEPHMEIYQPPYLFNANGTLATRPTITAAPASITYGSNFTVTTPNAASISSVVLVRNPTVTHAFGMDQREVGLTFTAGSGSLTVTAPANGNLAPPGYYMLFLVNSAGVPSVAQIVQIPSAP
jgi:trimeric autotransporter adhesin